MRKILITLALLASTSIPAYAVVNPEFNWLETTAKAEKSKAPEATKQGDEPFTEDTPFNLRGTRLQIVIPEGFIWKNGEAAMCCGENPNAFFNFWVEKYEETDENVRTQRGFAKIEDDSKRKANLMKSWNTRVHEDMSALDKAIKSKSTGLATHIVTVGEDIRALVATWFAINQQGVTFRVTEFEIWEGGQRDIIQFISMVEGNDRDKDSNHQMVLKMAQSLRMNRTEANPVWE